MYVYVIGGDSGPQKIGVAINPRRRLCLLQTGNPTPLKLSGAQDVPRESALSIERYAHVRLRNYRVRGEWFSVTPEHALRTVKEAVDAVAAGELEPEHELPAPEIFPQEPFTHRNYLAAINLLKLTEINAAAFLGVEAETSRRWVLGEESIPQAIGMYLRLLTGMRMTVAKNQEWMVDQRVRRVLAGEL